MFRVASLVACFAIAHATFTTGAERWNDDDLLSFKSRPDLRPPKLTTTIHNTEKLDPGYIFVAPYSYSTASNRITTFTTHQIGPTIYDNNGDLVWSGASMFPERHYQDFKLQQTSEGPVLSFMVGESEVASAPLARGGAVILDPSYQQKSNLSVQGGSFNLHEFSLINSGASAILVGHFDFEVEAQLGDVEGNWTGIVRENFFHEIQMPSQKVAFEWKGFDHMSLLESAIPHGMENTWDFMHMNSVDKNEDGNFLVSARHMDTIFLISGENGEVLWRLGGVISDFELQGFTFSRQHDARWREQNDTHIVLSFFDNAQDHYKGPPTAESSSLMVVALHKKDMVATVVERHLRPDGGHTTSRGNFQYLPNGNRLGCWSENAKLSEHTSDGEIVFEAQFTSERFSTYRGYKFSFKSSPVDTPAVKAFASATKDGWRSTVVYVSWNGATEVDHWRIYSAEDGEDSAKMLGKKEKTGFETSFVARGFHPIVFVEAVDVGGRSLANSTFETTELPPGWHGLESSSEPKFAGWVVKAGSASYSSAGMIWAFFAGTMVPMLLSRLPYLRRWIRRMNGRPCTDKYLDL